MSAVPGAPLRVAIDATPLLGEPTGVGTFVAGALGELAKRRGRDGVDVVAYGLTWNGRRLLPDVLPTGVSLPRVPMAAGPLLRQWEHGERPAIEWWTGRVDVVHGTNFVVPPTRHGRAARVVTVHDLTAVRFPELCNETSLRYPALVRRAVERGAWVHTPSAFVAGEVVEWLGIEQERVRSVPHGVDMVGGLAPAARPNGQSRTILSLATSEPRKDLPTLVRAFDLVADDRPDVRLAMAGARGWAEDEVAAAVGAAHHGDRIDRFGWVDADIRSQLLRTASVFAFPSRYEGFGLPPLEAMAAGLPVVASAAGAVPEAVGDAACLVPVGDADAMARALANLLDDEHLRDRVRRAGLVRAAGFTWARCADGLIDLYRDATA